MEKTNNSVFSRIMSLLLIAMGVFLGIYAFVAKAETRTLNGGTVTRNNMTGYLDAAFRNDAPSDTDIITALYGSGDEGSIYTQHWTGYDSESCLSAGMEVIYTGIMPTAIANHTIYVFASGVYDIPASVNLDDCVAFVSSGTAIFSGNLGTAPLIGMESKQNIILQNIAMDGRDAGDLGISMSGSQNITMYASKISSTDLYGINLFRTHYVDMKDSEFSGGIYPLFISGYNDHIFMDSLAMHNNLNDGEGGSSAITITNSDTISISNTNIADNYEIIHGDYANDILLSGNEFENNTGGMGFNFSSSLHFINSYLNGSIISIRGGTGHELRYFSGNSTISFSYFSGNNNSDVTLPLGYSIDSYSKNNNSITIDGQPYLTFTGNIANGLFYTLPYDKVTLWGIDQDNILLSGGIQGLIVGGSNRGGIFMGPVIITSGSKQATTEENGTDGIATFLGTIEVGSPDSSFLSLSGGYATITFSGASLGWSSGQHFSILRSSDGDLRTRIAGTGCTVDTQLKCSFSVTGIIDLFAFGVDASFSFTGSSLDGHVLNSGSIFNTGVRIYYTGIYLSGGMATLNGTPYTSSTLITSGGAYTFFIQDIGGNSTGASFTIDTIAPSITGATNGAYYNSNRTITGSDNLGFSGLLINGIFHTGNVITITGEGIRNVTGYDIAGNVSSAITFVIDKTLPLFTGTTLTSLPVSDGGYYATGIRIIFSDINLSGALLNGMPYASGTLITGDAAYTFIVTDLAGNNGTMHFTIDTISPIVTGNYPTSGLHITGGNTLTFSWSGSDANMSGYLLYIGSTGYAATGESFTTTLMNGAYNRYVEAIDHAGNHGTSQTFPFTLSTPLSGIVTLTGTNLISNIYTKDYVSLRLDANQPCQYTITGDIALGTISGSNPGSIIVSPYLTGADGTKYIYITLTTGSEIPVAISKTVILDTTAPSIGIIAPASGSTVEGNVSLSWSEAGADAVGLSGYQYIVSSTNTFATTTTSGYTTATGVTIGASNFTPSITYYRYAKTIDKLGNIGTSDVGSFFYSGTIDTTPDSFSFDKIEDAKLDRVYVSNTETITGMTPGIPVLASVSKGALYISGEMVGTTGYVQNGWTVKIELTSSDEYDDTISSTLTIDGISATFKIITISEDEDISSDYSDIDTDLSSTEKLQIIAVFETLSDLYAGDKAEEFFNTFMVMLENKMDDYDEGSDERNALKYLYDITQQYYDEGDFGDNVSSTSWIVNGVYTAPNGKKYTITYDSSKERFTSTNFVVPKYFPTLDSLKYIIDINNPAGSAYANAKTILARWKSASIDGTWQTSPYTAPNKKVFYFFKDISGRYSSYTFTSERYFNSLEEVKQYIYNANK